MSYGAYKHIDKNGECLYVGVTGDIEQRTYQHMLTTPWRWQIDKIEFIECANQEWAACTERELIRNIKPKYNKRHVDLPDDAALAEIHFVYTKHKFYDLVKQFFGFDSEAELANFLSVTLQHLHMVRLGIVGVTWMERRHVMDMLFCQNIGVMKSVLDHPGQWRIS